LIALRWPSLAADLSSPLVISAGTCGALAPELEVGDLVVPESVLGPAGERLNVTPGAHAAAVKLAGGVRKGLLLTSTDAVGTPEAKAQRWLATGALAVDMESAAILAWASGQGCSSLVVRAVSDNARQHVPLELIGLVTPEGKLRAARAVALALTHPRTIPHALILRRGTGQALKAVARLIAALVE
jgi:nucleoside phosphorylase